MDNHNPRSILIDESDAQSLIDAIHGLHVAIPLALIRVVGDLETAAYLGFSAFLSSAVRMQDGWFFLEQEKAADPENNSMFLRLGSFKESIGLSKDGQQRARHRLSKLHLHLELPSERQQKDGVEMPADAHQMVLLTQKRGAPPRLFYRVDQLNYVKLIKGDFSKAVNSAFEKPISPLSKDDNHAIRKRQNPRAIYRDDKKNKNIDNDNHNSGGRNLELGQIPEASRLAVIDAVKRCTVSDRQDVIDLTALAVKERRITKNAERYASALAKSALAGMLDRTPLSGYRIEMARRRETEINVSNAKSRPDIQDPQALATGTKILEKIRGKRHAESRLETQ